MGTRAVYTFKDEHKEHHVFKHWDGYPEGAIHFIKNGLKLAWPLPRFEACEFGGSFIAANKTKPGGGDFRLANHWKDFGDLDYRYEISEKEGKLFLRIFQRDWEHTRKNNYNNRTIKYKNIHNDFIDTLEKKYPCDWGDDATA